MDAQDHGLKEMERLCRGLLQGRTLLGSSVVYLRESVLEEAVRTLTEVPLQRLVTFGVKDTHQISKELVSRLQRIPGFLFQTLDKMSPGGRAIDVDLINPLTGKVMTGSTSGGCVNILKGVNDLALGTDGGGSVLAPAIATGLYGVMAKGMGLMGNTLKTSTDQLTFLPGIGVISHDYDLCRRSIQGMMDHEAPQGLSRSLVVAIPEEGAVTLPHGRDMASYLQPRLSWDQKEITFQRVKLWEQDDRESLIQRARELFDHGIDILLTAEGPIDLLGTGDSVLGQWGETGAAMQQQGGKYFLKVANLINATAVTIPTGDLGVGLVLMAPQGIQQGWEVIELGAMLLKQSPVPPLFQRYFIQGSTSIGWI